MMSYPEIVSDARVKNFGLKDGCWELELKDGLCFRNGTSIAYFMRIGQAQTILNGVIHKRGRQ